jgi:hypothetical protein
VRLHRAGPPDVLGKRLAVGQDRLSRVISMSGRPSLGGTPPERRTLVEEDIEGGPVFQRSSYDTSRMENACNSGLPDVDACSLDLVRSPMALTDRDIHLLCSVNVAP